MYRRNLNFNHVDTPSENVSDIYKFRSSQEVIDKVERHGLKLQKTYWAGLRKDKANRAGQQRHLMIFGFNNGEGFRLFVRNGHEGRTAQRFDAGYLRLACLNGMIAGDSIFSDRIIHKGNPKSVDEIIDAALSAADPMLETIEAMKNTIATDEARIALGRSLAALRGNLDIIPGSMRPQRVEDTGADLWTKFNVAQEYAIRGGFKYRKAKPGVEVDANGFANPLRRDDFQIRKGRAINGIDDTVQINKELWETAMAFV